jgi:hypothetical protein
MRHESEHRPLERNDGDRGGLETVEQLHQALREHDVSERVLIGARAQHVENGWRDVIGGGMIACAGQVTIDGGDYGMASGGIEQPVPVEDGGYGDGIIAAPAAGAKDETRFGAQRTEISGARRILARGRLSGE